MQDNFDFRNWQLDKVSDNEKLYRFKRGTPDLLSQKEMKEYVEWKARFSENETGIKY